MYIDPLEHFASSDSRRLRSVSAELATREDRIKERIRVVSDSSLQKLGPFNPPRARQFLDLRDAWIEEVASHSTSSRSAVRDARASNVVDRPTAKRLLSGMEEYDAGILKERAALAKNRVKLEYAILAHPAHARIGEAYLSAIVERLLNPAGATTNVQGSRDKHDQEQFRWLLAQACSPIESPHYEGALYCPVTRQWHDEDLIIASHIVPYAIGEVNVSYIFGLRPEEGYKAIWSYQNGLLLHKAIERALDAAQPVIVPVGDFSNDCKVMMLDEVIMSKNVFYKGSEFGSIHNPTLEFISRCKTGKRYLYFHCLISLFRRFRYSVNGQERDQQKIQMGKV